MKFDCYEILVSLGSTLQHFNRPQDFFFCKSHFLCLESFMNLEESRIPPFDLLPLRSIILTLHMVDLDTKNMIKSAKITEQFRDCLEH